MLVVGERRAEIGDEELCERYGIGGLPEDGIEKCDFLLRREGKGEERHRIDGRAARVVDFEVQVRRAAGRVARVAHVADERALLQDLSRSDALAEFVEVHVDVGVAAGRGLVDGVTFARAHFGAQDHPGGRRDDGRVEGCEDVLALVRASARAGVAEIGREIADVDAKEYRYLESHDGRGAQGAYLLLQRTGLPPAERRHLLCGRGAGVVAEAAAGLRRGSGLRECRERHEYHAENYRCNARACK